MEAKERKEGEEYAITHPAKNIYTLKRLASDVTLLLSLQQTANETGKVPYARSPIYRDLRRLQGGSYHHRNGRTCAVQECEFKDLDFHHLDYKNDLGIYLCRLHHSMQHLDKAGFAEFFLMMVARGLTKFSIEVTKDSIKVDVKPKGFQFLV